MLVRRAVAILAICVNHATYAEYSSISLVLYAPFIRRTHFLYNSCLLSRLQQIFHGNGIQTQNKWFPTLIPNSLANRLDITIDITDITIKIFLKS